LESFQKSKENWSHDELKRATTITKTKVAKVRAKPKTNGTAHKRIHHATTTVQLLE